MANVETSMYRYEDPDYAGKFMRGMQMGQQYKQNRQAMEKQQREEQESKKFDLTLRGLAQVNDPTTSEGRSSLIRDLHKLGYVRQAMGLQNEFQALEQKPKAKQFQQVKNKAGQIVGWDAETGMGADGQPVEAWQAPVKPEKSNEPTAYQKEQDARGWAFKEKQLSAINADRSRPKAGDSAPGEVKLTPAQSGMMAEISEANSMVDNMASAFNKAGMAASPGKAYMADVVESLPFVGGKLAPKTSQYNDDRRITAEKFLRAATGAAAPEAEVKKYSAMLPEPGDNGPQAQSAIDSFRGAVKAKALSVATALDLQGRTDEGAALRGRLDKMFSSGVKIDAASKAPSQSGGVVKWGRDASGKAVRLQ